MRQAAAATFSNKDPKTNHSSRLKMMSIIWKNSNSNRALIQIVTKKWLKMITRTKMMMMRRKTKRWLMTNKNRSQKQVKAW